MLLRTFGIFSRYKSSVLIVENVRGAEQREKQKPLQGTVPGRPRPGVPLPTREVPLCPLHYQSGPGVGVWEVTTLCCFGMVPPLLLCPHLPPSLSSPLVLGSWPRELHRGDTKSQREGAWRSALGEQLPEGVPTRRPPLALSASGWAALLGSLSHEKERGRQAEARAGGGRGQAKQGPRG